MKRPILQDQALLADIQSARAHAPVHSGLAPLSLWWLGQSGFLVHWNGKCVAFDPYLSDSLTRKYAATDKPHVRLTGRVVAPERLDFVDVVTSSHNHTDHLDPDTLQPLARANPKLIMVCPEANRPTVRERTGLPDQRIVGLDAVTPPDPPPSSFPGQTRVLDLRFTAIPAAHENLDRDAAGRCLYLGFVVQFGPFTLYHSGDTVRFDGMAELLRTFEIDLALLPINGRVPERRVAGNLWGREAAELAKAMKARCVVPCHYDLFEFNTASPDEFVAHCGRLGQAHVVLQQGERLTLGEKEIACPSTSRAGGIPG